MRVYYGGQSGTMEVRETIRIHGSSSAGTIDRLTEARNASGTFQTYPLHGETTTYQTGAGPAFFVTPECPTPSFQSTSEYGVGTDTLTLFDDADGIERVYQRVQ
jgi:hypothetical protein